MKEPILVTGAHRTGTTFVGKMLSLPPNIGYIHEPFNVDYGLKEFQWWYLYIHKDVPREDYYSQLIKNFLEGKGKFKRTKAKKSDNLYNRVGRNLFRSHSHLQYKKAIWNPWITRYLIKDPIAAFSSEWLHEKFNMNVIVLVRHPAAFVSSLRRLDWKFDFNEFFKQKFLIDHHLNELLSTYDTRGMDFIEKAALLWACIYMVLQKYVERNERFSLIKLEDVSRDPISMFNLLYQKLNLSFTSSVRHEIEVHTNESNPVEPYQNKTFSLKRNSTANISVWKNRLSQTQVNKIHAIAGDLARNYYGYDDWDIS